MWDYSDDGTTDEPIGQRVPKWVTWTVFILLIALLLGLPYWLGAQADWASKPAPNYDPAFNGPAWFPGDVGVTDLRRDQK